MENEGRDLHVEIGDMLSKEKQMIEAGDLEGSWNVSVDIIELCFRRGSWIQLNEQILQLFKRRGDLSEIAQELVFRLAMHYIDQAPDAATKTELIKTINRAVTSAKRYAESRKGQMIKKLTKMEEQGLISETARLMLDVEENGGTDLEVAIEGMLCMEKQMRQAGDVEGTCNAVAEVIELCFQAGAWDKLNEQILLRFQRGELTEIVQGVVFRLVLQYLDQTIDVEAKTELMKTLDRAATSLKDYAEMRKAQVVKKPAATVEDELLRDIDAEALIKVEHAEERRYNVQDSIWAIMYRAIREDSVLLSEGSISTMDFLVTAAIYVARQKCHEENRDNIMAADILLGLDRAVRDVDTGSIDLDADPGTVEVEAVPGLVDVEVVHGPVDLDADRGRVPQGVFEDEEDDFPVDEFGEPDLR